MSKKKKKNRTHTHASRHTPASPDKLIEKYRRQAVQLPDGSITMPLAGGEHNIVMSEGPRGMSMMQIPTEAYTEHWRELPGSDMHTLPGMTNDGQAVILCYREKTDHILISDGEKAIPANDDDGFIADSLKRSGAVRVADVEEAAQLPVTTDWTYRITGTEPYAVPGKEGMYIAGLVLRGPHSQTGPAYYDGTVFALKEWFLSVKQYRRMVVCSVQSIKPEVKMWGSVAHPLVGRRA